MKIIITNTFEKKFLWKLTKYFTVSNLVEKLKKEQIKITLKDPFYKIKFKLNLVDFRWIVLIVEDDKIIPLMLYLKKDKKNWENIIWSEYENRILEIQKRVSIDLENWDFKVY